MKSTIAPRPFAMPSKPAKLFGYFDMKNATKLEIDNFIDQPYSFPGSYPKVAIMADGGCLCHKCARDNIQILLDTTDPEWTVLQIEINYEDNLWCDHCGDPIEQAYGDN